jgi:hypothetical protein
MDTQYTIESLRERIRELELRQGEEGKILKTQLRVTLDSLKPINLIKSVVNDVFESKSLRNEFVTNAAAYASGLITKKLVIGNSKNPAVKLLGLGIQLAMTTVISKNYAALKEVIIQLAGLVFTKIQEDTLYSYEQTDDTKTD